MTRSIHAIAALALVLDLGLLSAAEPVGPASEAARSELTEVNGDAVDAYIRASMQAAKVPGLSLAVVRGADIAYLKGYGMAGPDGRPVTPETPFILGSTSKSFTALAVMQLVEAGKLQLDAPVTRYLPWFRTEDATASARISVRHLLHHTSGLPTPGGLHGLWEDDQSGRALENGVRELSNTHLRQPPGLRYEYSNENYNTLGLMVQTIAGVSYEEYIRSSIFGPLQMRHSAAAPSDAPAVGMASGYRYWLRRPIAFDAPYPRRATPAGFLISSARDMAHYIVAQLNGGRYQHSQLLSPQGIAALHNPGSSVTPTISYGMGWAIHSSPGSTRIWHDGDVSNFHSHLRLLPDQRLGFVVLMNVGGLSNGTAFNNLVDGIAATLLGHSQPAPIDSPWTTSLRLTALVPLLIAVLWTGWSFRSLRRWHRGEPPPHGLRRFLRLYLPLAVDLSAPGVIWILMPASAEIPVGAIRLFAPDVFASLVATTSLLAGCAIGRAFTAVRFRWFTTSTHAASVSLEN